jgi:hypothetical protein
MVSKDTFFLKECVIKLGLIYISLVVMCFIYLEYRSNQGMWWMNGVIFASHDKTSVIIFILILITSIYGAYIWIRALFSIVFKIEILTKYKILYTVYLITAPIIARILTTEIFYIFLTNSYPR